MTSISLCETIFLWNLRMLWVMGYAGSSFRISTEMLVYSVCNSINGVLYTRLLNPNPSVCIRGLQFLLYRFDVNDERE